LTAKTIKVNRSNQMQILAWARSAGRQEFLYRSSCSPLSPNVSHLFDILPTLRELRDEKKG
jgi:hypothetical protein